MIETVRWKPDLPGKLMPGKLRIIDQTRLPEELVYLETDNAEEIFDYINENDILEKETFNRLVKDKELTAYKHKGFWECMDTFKDSIELNEMWNSNNAKWAVWKK